MCVLGIVELAQQHNISEWFEPGKTMKVSFRYYPVVVLLCFALWYALLFVIDVKLPTITQRKCIIPRKNTLLTIKQTARQHVSETISQHGLKTILFWNEFYEFANYTFGFGQQPFLDHNCPTNTCYTTANKSHIPIEQYDAIIFHIRNFHDAPKHRSPHQRYIFFTFESPQYISYEIRPSDKYFNWTMTYNIDADICIPYGVIRLLPETLLRSPKHNTNVKNKEKRKIAAWMVSHCDTHSHREEYVYMLQRYLPIDVYGDCGNLTCPKSSSESCWDLIASQYKFYFSFENSLCRDYVTEKFFIPMSRNIVPVVFGAANYSSLAPPNSFINALDFTPSGLAKYLHWLAENDEEYQKFFQWKAYYTVEFPKDMGFCELCAKLHENSPHKTYDMKQWWSETNNCNTIRRPAPPFNTLHDVEKLIQMNNNVT